MTTIGSFVQQDDSYSGTLRTLTLEVALRIAPTAKEGEKAPDFRVYAGLYELGAAWRQTAKNGQAYLSVKLDDPLFPVPVYARLVEAQAGRFSLIWSRRGV